MYCEIFTDLRSSALSKINSQSVFSTRDSHCLNADALFETLSSCKDSQIRERLAIKDCSELAVKKNTPYLNVSRLRVANFSAACVLPEPSVVKSAD